jgi:glycine/D-amino acid oxidase-like deaminating enzyme
LTQYRADRLPVHRGPAAWAAILGDYVPQAPLAQDMTADVVVIGAGFAGLSAALRVTQIDPAARVIVLEAGALAEGASGRNSGFMIDIPHDLASQDYAGGAGDLQMIRLNRLAQKFAQNAVETFDINRDFFDPVGKVNGAASAKAHAHNASFSRHLAQLNEPSEMLDQQQMQDMTGSPHYRSGLFTPGTVMLQPAGYIRGLAQGLRHCGVMIFENTPALQFERRSRNWEVKTPTGKISAGRVILANNGHLESFGIARNRLMQLFLFAVMTPEIALDALAKLGGQSRWGVTPSNPMGTTVRRIDSGQGGNRIVTRTCAVLRPGMQTTARDLKRATHVMQKKFDQRFPQLKGMQMAHAWAGHLCLTMNSVSVAREIDQGVFSACVQNGLGTARGTLTGIAAAERAMGQGSEITAFFDAESPPTRLPPQPVRQWGANAVLRWKEHQAAQD